MSRQGWLSSEFKHSSLHIFLSSLLCHRPQVNSIKAALSEYKYVYRLNSDELNQDRLIKNMSDDCSEISAIPALEVIWLMALASMGDQECFLSM